MAGMSYISSRGVERASRYQYIGRDKSVIYKYIGSPVAQWCVDNLLPEWMAPNLVSGAPCPWVWPGAPFPHPPAGYPPGLGAACDYLHPVWDLQPPPDFRRHPCLALHHCRRYADCLLRESGTPLKRLPATPHSFDTPPAQILDNMDGKQARKTGSSSPLGLLFDHGCDALNATVVCTLATARALPPRQGMHAPHPHSWAP